jgi:GMP synthase-like glutamine amidotransferase
MKPVLILQHQLPENAAYLTTWLVQHGVEYQVVNAGAGEQFPDSIDAYAALAVMGGGMSANDDLASNRQAEQLIVQAMNQDIPVIGHCLGGQLMSRALGAKVTVAAIPEIGWQPIKYADHDLARQWFGSEPTDTVIHWHYDTFSIPLGATLLASSPNCANQAWGIGPHLAMQFHIEINEPKIDSWVAEDDDKWMAARALFESAQSRQTILTRTADHIVQHQRTADNIYTHWLSTTAWAGK